MERQCEKEQLLLKNSLLSNVLQTVQQMRSFGNRWIHKKYRKWPQENWDLILLTQPKQETRERENKSSLNKTRLQQVPKRLENIVSRQPEREWLYEDIVGIFRRELERYWTKQRGKRKQEHKLKSWSDKEVYSAIAPRQEASREHRQSKKRWAIPAEVASKWEKF